MKLYSIKKSLKGNPGIGFCIVFSIIVFYATFVLFNGQMILFHNGNASEYLSDLPSHVWFAINGTGYGLVSLLLRYSYYLGGDYGVAFLLSTISVLTLWVAATLLLKLIKWTNRESEISYVTAFLISAPVVFIGSMYLPRFYNVMYILNTSAGRLSTDFTQPWHNSTYLAMKASGTLAVIIFFSIDRHYLKRLTLKEWIVFTLSLTLVNAAKPNFFVAFAPAMLCFLIYDFIRLKGHGTLQMIKFGSAVLCSMPILFIDAMILYPQDGGSGVTITTQYFENAIKEGWFFPYLIAGSSFVIMVSAICILKKKTNRIFWFGWLSYLFSFLERWFIWETGSRASHGNFSWGVKFFAFLLTIICIERLIYMRKTINRSVLYLAILLLVFMVMSGVAFFISQSQGMSYWW